MASIASTDSICRLETVTQTRTHAASLHPPIRGYFATVLPAMQRQHLLIAFTALQAPTAFRQSAGRPLEMLSL